VGAAVVACASAWSAAAPANLASAAEPVPEVAPAQAAEAAQLFEQGVAARKAGKLAQAESLFSKALAIEKTWEIAANLGFVELELGKLPEGADHVFYGLANLPLPEPDGARKSLFEAFSAARRRVGGIDVHVDVIGAEVRIGGKLKGTTPLRYTQFVAPGQVTIEVTKDGYVPAIKTIDFKEGSSLQTEFSLVKQAPQGRSIVAPAIAFGAGGAGLIVGVVAGAVAAVKRDTLGKTCGPEMVCPKSARADLDEAHTLANVSNVGLVVAGIGAAAGVTLLLLPSGKSVPTTSVVIGPSFVGVKGAF